MLWAMVTKKPYRLLYSYIYLYFILPIFEMLCINCKIRPMLTSVICILIGNHKFVLIASENAEAYLGILLSYE